jgi:hypothetical protein
VKEVVTGISLFEIKHIPLEDSSCADFLSKLSSKKKSSQHHTVIEETIPQPCIILQAEVEDW